MKSQPQTRLLQFDVAPRFADVPRIQSDGAEEVVRAEEDEDPKDEI